jgi:phenylalanine-4-hydroxylase
VKRDVGEETAAIFAVASKPGALQDALAVFKEMEVDLLHIESRPSRTTLDQYEFYITSKSPEDKVGGCS